MISEGAKLGQCQSPASGQSLPQSSVGEAGRATSRGLLPSAVRGAKVQSLVQREESRVGLLWQKSYTLGAYGSWRDRDRWVWRSARMSRMPGEGHPKVSQSRTGFSVPRGAFPPENSDRALVHPQQKPPRSSSSGFVLWYLLCRFRIFQSFQSHLAEWRCSCHGQHS